MKDRYGLELSTSSASARDSYVEGIDRMLSADAGVEECLSAAITADPEFALPHAALARQHQLYVRPAEARASAETAVRLSRGATAREQQHVEIVRLLVASQVREALDLIRQHIAEYPRDAFALAPACGVFGAIGFSGRIGREAELLALLEPLATHYGNDWWFATVHAFALIETGQWDRGRQLAERALEQRPKTPHGAHTLVHALFEAGTDDEAVDFLDGWLAGSDRASVLHCHIWWHYALVLMAVSRHDDAWQAFRNNCLPGATASPPITVFSDSSSFMWRSELAGKPRDRNAWQRVREFYEERFPQPVVFVDAHVGLMYAALGETEQLQACVAQLQELGDAAQLPAGTTGANLTRAYAAFENGDWATAIDVLEPLIPQVVRIGGSRAQRDLMTNTLLAAYVKADRPDDARAFLERVTDRQPSRPVAGLATGRQRQSQGTLTLKGSEYVQQFDVVPQFWQFLRGLHSDDLIVELIQNDLDASALCTSITFGPDRLICQGDGEPIREDGWRRLSFVMGAGDEVQSKRFQIGVKNHGLKACFWLGDEIIVRSDNRRMSQTLYKDGFDNRPSPATFREPVLDSSAPPTGCTIEVPYRKQELRVTTGEGLTLPIPDKNSMERLFKSACELLPSKLLGVVRPGLRDRYTVHLSHHALGAVEIHWRAKRGRKIKPRGRREFTVFSRECHVSSKTTCVPTDTMHERAAIFRLPFPIGERREIPDFFSKDRKSFWAEIAWAANKKGKPRSSRGVRRYPIGYSDTSETGCTGVGVHFSAPYFSDAERHSANQMDSLNSYIDDACKDALVDFVTGHLVHRYSGKAMELYVANSAGGDDSALTDLVERTIDKRALPLNGRRSRTSKGFERVALGPNMTTGGTLRRVVLPMFSWDQERISPLLSAICPSDEAQIDVTVPGAILHYLANRSNNGDYGEVITFDETDAIERLQPHIEANWFPWTNESEWQTRLSSPSTAEIYMDILYETIQANQLESESKIKDNIYLPDEREMVRPLAEMFSAVNLPPNILQEEYVHLLHPRLQGHRLLKKKVWKPKPYRLEDFLHRVKLETASLEERESFWTWLRDNWQSVKPRKILNQIATSPVWPSTNGELLPLADLCDPRDARVAAIIGDAIVQPSRELLRTGILNRSGRGHLRVRSTPSIQEFEEYLAKQTDQIPRMRKLAADERQRFSELEKNLAVLASSMSQLKEYLGVLGPKYGVAVDADGTLRTPSELVQTAGALQHLHLLREHIIDRPTSILDRIDGWKPRTSPSTDQIVETFRIDGSRIEAHVPRLQEYVKQSKREGKAPEALLDVACIPAQGTLRTPNQIALRGAQDFWGEWKIRVPVTDINPEIQRLYKTIGVTGGTPNSTSSRQFFQWLAMQDTDCIGKHTGHVLRHINHKLGPLLWSAEFPSVPFIMVSSSATGVRLVTTAQANAKRSKVVIPDFKELEDAIRLDPTRSPVEIAIVESPLVTMPIKALLRELGVQTLRDYAGEPVRVTGKGQTNILPPDYRFREILDSLDSGLKGRQLHKRLANLDLDSPDSSLRSNWRERLRTIRNIRIADSVVAMYGLGRHRYSIPVEGKVDKDSGILWLDSSADLRRVFFDVVAEHVFTTPKKYHGLVLDAAYGIVVTERHPEAHTDTIYHQEDTDVGDAVNPREADSVPTATSARHFLSQRDRQRNIPSPGPIPQTNATTGNVGTARRMSGSGASSRVASASETAQIADLKEKQYAWHCQACLAETQPKTLAPESSYVEHSNNRRQLMEAHHCDHVNAGGARHAGNILLLCHYHHGALGDTVTRTEISRSMDRAASRRLTFNSDDNVSSSIQGKVVRVQPPHRKTPVLLFFTTEHADYWLHKATEEGLL